MKNKLNLVLIFILFFSCNGGGGGGGGGDATSSSSNKYTDTVIDPLGDFQWHMKNVGQQSYISLPTINSNGIDINISDVHSSFRGENQTVVVADGRIDLNHEDLVHKADYDLSRNYVISTSSSNNPTSANDNDTHGTSVMGFIGAAKGNGKGGFGVAPLAKLVGINFLDSDQSVSKEQSLIGYISNGLYNFSFGFKTCKSQPFNSTTFNYLKWHSEQNNRVYVTSAGNDYVGNRSSCSGGTGVYLGNSNLDQVKSLPYYITVGAIDHLGKSASYSTPGSNIFISAPGGEDYSIGLPLLALDIEGCNNGNSKGTSTVAFDKNQYGTNPNCNYYTDTASGTSFAAPMVTGAIALIREALPSNKNSRKYVKRVLAKTAKKVDSSSVNLNHPLGADISGHQYDLGWIKNGASYNFHNFYGFGVLDVDAAVKYAKDINTNLNLYENSTIPESKNTFTHTGGYFYTSQATNVSIPDNSSTGITTFVTVGSHNLEIEHVLVNVNITHPWPGDLGLELINGTTNTKSKLMLINSNYVGSNLTNVTFGTNAFYGERTLGNWYLKVNDGASGLVGTLNNWSINFLGNRTFATSNTKPLPPSNLIRSGNTISWTHSPDTIRRYEVLVVSADDSRLDYEGQWSTVSSSSNSILISKYQIIGYHNISSGSQYKILIRAIGMNEMESDIVEYIWTAI